MREARIPIGYSLRIVDITTGTSAPENPFQGLLVRLRDPFHITGVEEEVSFRLPRQLLSAAGQEVKRLMLRQCGRRADLCFPFEPHSSES